MSETITEKKETKTEKLVGLFNLPDEKLELAPRFRDMENHDIDKTISKYYKKMIGIAKKEERRSGAVVYSLTLTLHNTVHLTASSFTGDFTEADFNNLRVILGKEFSDSTNIGEDSFTVEGWGRLTKGYSKNNNIRSNDGSYYVLEFFVNEEIRNFHFFLKPEIRNQINVLTRRSKEELEKIRLKPFRFPLYRVDTISETEIQSLAMRGYDFYDE